MKSKKKIYLIIFLVLLFSLGSLVIYYYFSIYAKRITYKNQWGLYNYGQTVEENKGTNGIDINIASLNTKSSDTRTIIALIDSGIDLSIFNSDNIFINNGEIPDNGIDDDNNGFIDDINGWDFYNFDNTIYDNYLSDYHGTYITSLIIGSSKQNDFIPVSPNSIILPIKCVEGSKGDIDDLILGIEYAHAMGAKIVNCSWDFADFNDKLYSTIKKYDDMLFVCTAGKFGNDLKNTPAYPACFNLDNIIVVTAIDNNGDVVSNSGYGSYSDIAAPGKSIYGILPEGDITYSDGTSPATAYVSGIASVIYEYCGTLSPMEVKDIIKKSAKKLNKLDGIVDSGGIVDVAKCIDIVIKSNIPN